MSALGQKRTLEDVPIADIGTQSRNVRYVPKADIAKSGGCVCEVTITWKSTDFRLRSA